MSNSLRPHGLQHSRLPCPLLSPRVCSNSCQLSRWSCPTILSSVTLFSCLQSFPASGSFPKSQVSAWLGQSIRASASVSALPMNIQGCFLLGLAGLILLSKGLSRVFSRTTVWKPQFFGSAFFEAQLSYPYMTTGKTIWLYRPLLAKWCLLLNMLSRFLIAFLPRSKRLLISWLQSPSTVILEPKKINLSLFPFFPPYIYYEVMGLVAMILAFWMLSFNPAFSLSSLTFIKRLFGSSLLSAIRVLSSEVIDISTSNLDSSLWFIQPSISHDILCIWVK